MEEQRNITHARIDEGLIEKLKAELTALDHYTVDVDGAKLRPSQCYHFDIDPVHVLFNTNCPDALRERVNSILSKYIPDESPAK